MLLGRRHSHRAMESYLDRYLLRISTSSDGNRLIANLKAIGVVTIRFEASILQDPAFCPYTHMAQKFNPG
jgi:hypothetical protein